MPGNIFSLLDTKWGAKSIPASLATPLAWTVAASALACLMLIGPPDVAAQVLAPVSPAAPVDIPNPLSDTSVKPGKAILFELESQFARATAQGGGKAFASWFAEDGVSLGKGQAPVHGKEAIARQATWSPQSYQLTWTPTDAVLSPGGDMGYTWGHYEGRSHDADGNTTVTTGRYLTIWRKDPQGDWKVVLDASSDEPPGADDCCKLPPGE